MPALTTTPPADLSPLAREIKKRRPFEDPAEEAYLNLLRTASALGGGTEQLFKQCGLSGPKYNVLRILRGAALTGEAGPMGLPSLEVAARLITRVPDITRLVDNLEAAGLVARTRCTNDRRIVFVGITPAGLDLLAQIDRPIADYHRACMEADHPGRQELAELSRLLPTCQAPHLRQAHQRGTGLTAPAGTVRASPQIHRCSSPGSTEIRVIQGRRRGRPAAAGDRYDVAMPTLSPILSAADATRMRVVGITTAQYDYLVENGQLAEDPTTELLDGLIVAKDRSAAGEDIMTVGDRHRLAVRLLAKLDPQFNRLGHFAQSQQPIALPPNSMPEPDLSVVRGTDEDYRYRKPAPADVTCVVEVADSSLARDLGPKLRAYARAKIPQYVVVDLTADRVLVHTRPHGRAYRDVVTLAARDTLRLSAGDAGSVPIRVARLF